MTRIKRPAAAVGVAALLAFSLTACGGGSPDDASKGDFCDDVTEAFNQDFASDPTEDEWNDFKDDVEALADTGTPENISDDARDGFEAFVDAVDDLDYDDVKDADEDEDFGLDDEDQENFEKFFAYVGTECAEEFGIPDVPTDIPTDLPTDIPTDLTDIPTDIPTDLSDLTEIPSDLLSELSDLTAIPTS
ncbi:hypothetical protein F0U44_06820 [Nocardioides humilatus]|uniref:Uncharacterized protein n=1 Tax=Nocardioides humilatus TaxID=2607660 RepID=A0A5B1LMF7_9ACTN|nr:hypothetical protein [Nocardioides humilatus]KAA1421965.1 hypothetical protein F0U44_06820 [Nocardioides humilatus]